MEELTVPKKPESFDEILRKYKMQVEITKGKNEPTPISPRMPDAAPHTDHVISPIVEATQPQCAKVTDNDIVIMHEANTSKHSVVPKPDERRRPLSDADQWQLSMHNSARISRSLAARVVNEPLRHERILRPVMLLDTTMAYFDMELVAQCKYPVLSGANVTMIAASNMIHEHWEQQLEMGTVNTNTHHQLYVIMPSMDFLVQHLIGDGLKNAIDDGRIDNGYTDSLEYQSALKKYLKATKKYFKEISSKDPSFYPDEVKQWSEVLKCAYEDVGSFINEMKEDLGSIRGYLDTKQRLHNVFKSFQEEGKLAVKDEKDASKSDGEDVSDKSTRVSASSDCTDSDTLVCLFEVLAQKMKVTGAPVVTLDSDGECDDTTDVVKARLIGAAHTNS